jgi:hypothetical protein
MPDEHAEPSVIRLERIRRNGATFARRIRSFRIKPDQKQHDLSIANLAETLALRRIRQPQPQDGQIIKQGLAVRFGHPQSVTKTSTFEKRESFLMQPSGKDNQRPPVGLKFVSDSGSFMVLRYGHP